MSSYTVPRGPDLTYMENESDFLGCVRYHHRQRLRSVPSRVRTVNFALTHSVSKRPNHC